MTDSPEADGGISADEPVSEAKDEKVKTGFDFSKIDPEKAFLCFGTIDPQHQECIECPCREKCAVKAGVAI